MTSLNLRLIFIGIAILLLALVPWARLAFAAYKNKRFIPTVVKGAAVTVGIVGLVLALMFVTLDFIGEYGVYLMMVSLIFGSWLGYLATKRQMQEVPLRPIGTPK